jgi:hypothetical protein
MSATVTDRFWRKVTKTDTCWTWIAARNSKGYGVVSVAGHLYLSHRVAYTWLVGPIPQGLTIDHLCRNKLCVRPDHLEPVTIRENISRAHERTHVCRHGEMQRYRKDRLYGLECPECYRVRTDSSDAFARIFDAMDFTARRTA